MVLEVVSIGYEEFVTRFVGLVCLLELTFPFLSFEYDYLGADIHSRQFFNGNLWYNGLREVVWEGGISLFLRLKTVDDVLSGLLSEEDYEKLDLDRNAYLLDNYLYLVFDGFSPVAFPVLVDCLSKLCNKYLLRGETCLLVDGAKKTYKLRLYRSSQGVNIYDYIDFNAKSADYVIESAVMRYGKSELCRSIVESSFIRIDIEVKASIS